MSEGISHRRISLIMVQYLAEFFLLQSLSPLYFPFIIKFHFVHYEFGFYLFGLYIVTDDRDRRKGSHLLLEGEWIVLALAFKLQVL